MNYMTMSLPSSYSAVHHLFRLLSHTFSIAILFSIGKMPVFAQNSLRYYRSGILLHGQRQRSQAYLPTRLDLLGTMLRKKRLSSARSQQSTIFSTFGSLYITTQARMGQDGFAISGGAVHWATWHIPVALFGHAQYTSKSTAYPK